MKIKTKRVPLAQAMAIKPPKHKHPGRPWFLFRTLVRLLSIGELRATKFTYEKVDMERAGKGPYLILMNHSSFLDLKIASKIFYPKPYNIVSTTDGLVGKEWLMRVIGCTPTQKFVPDISLIGDIQYALHKKKRSVLMYPEAGYSFDGCATTLPRRLGMLLKRLKVPVVSVITQGAFLHQPLYNELHMRKTKVTATVKCILTPDEIASKSVAELDAILDETFNFDAFAYQRQHHIPIKEDNRADGLNRILYRCASCGAEGQMEGKGTTLTCHHCGKTYVLDEYGMLEATEGETEFPHIPDWYHWERDCVKREIASGAYQMDLDVEIGILADYKALYLVGNGRLVHTPDGFTLTHENGEVLHTQPPTYSHSLNADYFWYEIGDVICVGNKDRLFYCFPREKDVVTKARLATEELYTLAQASRRSRRCTTECSPECPCIEETPTPTPQS